MTDMPEHVVTQSESTYAGPMAQVDVAAQEEVQRQLNVQVARETKVPFKAPEVPPGLSPNQKVAWASAQGTISGSTAADAIQTDQPQESEPERKPDDE